MKPNETERRRLQREQALAAFDALRAAREVFDIEEERSKALRT
jgi:hypothetical protein